MRKTISHTGFECGHTELAPRNHPHPQPRISNVSEKIRIMVVVIKMSVIAKSDFPSIICDRLPLFGLKAVN